MYEMTVTLTTPFVADDEDIVYPLSLPDKKAVRKVERALIRGLVHLGNLADDALDNPGGIFEGSDPQEVHLIYLVTKNGVKWTKSTQEWPNQTDQARAFLAGMLKQLMSDAGHGDKAKRVPKGKGRR